MLVEEDTTAGKVWKCAKCGWYIPEGLVHSCGVLVYEKGWSWVAVRKENIEERLDRIERNLEELRRLLQEFNKEFGDG